MQRGHDARPHDTRLAATRGADNGDESPGVEHCEQLLDKSIAPEEVLGIGLEERPEPLVRVRHLDGSRDDGRAPVRRVGRHGRRVGELGTFRRRERERGGELGDGYVPVLRVGRGCPFQLEQRRLRDSTAFLDESADGQLELFPMEKLWRCCREGWAADDELGRDQPQ